MVKVRTLKMRKYDGQFKFPFILERNKKEPSHSEKPSLNDPVCSVFFAMSQYCFNLLNEILIQ